MRLTFVSSPSPENRMNARSLRAARVGAVPGGQLDLVGVDALHVGDVRAEVALLARRRRARTCGSPRRPAASSARSGSVTILVTWPSSASRAMSPSGRMSTATAPRRLSAATTASELGRLDMSTPTCSPWRTPSETSPRTTASMRAFAADRVCARSSNRNRMSSGPRLACSSRSRPSEMRVAGVICSSRASRGSWPAASRVSSRAVRTLLVAVAATARAIPAPTVGGELDAVADAVPHGGAVGLDVVERLGHGEGQLALALDPARPPGDDRPGRPVGRRADDQPEVRRRAGRPRRRRPVAPPGGSPARRGPARSRRPRRRSTGSGS